MKHIKEQGITNNMHIHKQQCVLKITTYESILGIFLVGTVVTNWPHNNVPIPKNRHHSHCSKLKLAVENAILPNSIIRT
jgi:mannose/fructose/N-acetylgalactosamine-specific phosphotransferase system component IID